MSAITSSGTRFVKLWQVANVLFPTSKYWWTEMDKRIIRVVFASVLVVVVAFIINVYNIILLATICFIRLVVEGSLPLLVWGGQWWCHLFFCLSITTYGTVLCSVLIHFHSFNSELTFRDIGGAIALKLTATFQQIVNTPEKTNITNIDNHLKLCVCICEKRQNMIDNRSKNTRNKHMIKIEEKDKTNQSISTEK